MKLYIIRHGETPWNRELRLQGQTDIALNENGRLLAQETARALQDVSFDLAFTSPLARARETAQIVLNGRTVPLYEDARIQEISFGIYEGVQFKDAKGNVTYSELRNFFKSPELYEAPQDGESLDTLCARTGAFLDELAARSDLYGKTILVSTHGAASRALLRHIKKCALADFWDTGVPKNCAVTIAELVSAENPGDTEAIRKPKICGSCGGRELTAAGKTQWIIKEQDVLYYENV